MTDERDISIRVQSAAHDAATIIAALRQPGEAFDVADFANIHSQVYLHLSQFIDSELETLAANLVGQAFPGTTEAPPYVPPVPETNVMPMFPDNMMAQPPAPPQPTQWHPSAGAPAPSMPQYPPPPVPQAPPAAGMQCPKCGGGMYDNRNDNARKRATGFKLGAEFKCKNPSCKNPVWPADFQSYAHLPQEPRR